LIFNRRISIQQCTQDPDGQGGLTEPVYTEYWQTNAYLNPLTAGKKLEDNQATLNNAVVFTVRFRRDKEVTKDMQVIDAHTGLVYQVTAVTELHDKRDLLEIRGTTKQ
jgi:SPP1 family predicted phage head-tail adaptor